MLLSMIVATFLRKDMFLEEHEDAVLGSQEDGQGAGPPFSFDQQSERTAALFLERCPH